MIQYPKKDRGGASLVGWEQPHIYRDPPKSIWTRKKELVNAADVMYMVQADNASGDPTRINEAIQLYARGKNPMVAVDYGNGRGASNPYKVEVVRPPLMPLETLVPLSAPHTHQNYSITTNAGSVYTSQTNGDSIDKDIIKNVTNRDRTYGIVNSNPSQDLSFGPVIDKQMLANKLTFDKSIGSIVSAPSLTFISGEAENALRNTTVSSTRIKENLLKELNTNYSSIVLYDPKTNTSVSVNASIRDRNYIAINAQAGKPIVVSTADGKNIKLKDYVYSVVKPNIGNSQLVIQVKQPEVLLDRNMPLYAATTNIQDSKGYNEQLTRLVNDQYSTKDKFTDKITTFGAYTDRVTMPMRDPNAYVPVGSSIRKQR
jgi:hypothetical protein